MNHSESRRLFLKAVGAGVGTAAVGLPFAANALDSKNANFFYQQNSISQGHGLLTQLTEKFEHRLCGSKNAFEAEQFCHDQFTAMGFTDVRFEPFVKDVWNRGHLSKMDIIADNGQSYSVSMVAFGGSPSPVDVKAEVVDLADAMEENYQNIDVKGKIVIGNIGMDDGSKAPHRSVKVALALKKGAAGIILHNDVKNNILLTGGAGRHLPIPAASVGLEDGMDIRNKLKTQKLHAHIRMDGNHYVNATHRNVVAVLPGSEKPEEIIVIGAHLDTWDLSPGAIDNGVGVATVMDIAQHLVSLAKKPKRTIHFILFAAEEQGLYGSFHNVDLLIKNNQIDNVKYMINIDMMANAKGFNSVGHKGTEQFVEMVGKHIASLDSTYPNINEHKKFSPGVDHKPYMLQGIPVILPMQGMDTKMVRPTYHTDRDTMDKVKPEYLENNFRRVGELITILANLDSVPAVKMDDEQTKQWMLKHNFKDALMRTNNWRWEATS